MAFDSIIGYKYEADLHCIACTAERFYSEVADLQGMVDVNGIPYVDDARTRLTNDNDGNEVWPIFHADELFWCRNYCGDCFDPLDWDTHGDDMPHCGYDDCDMCGEQCIRS